MITRRDGGRTNDRCIRVQTVVVENKEDDEESNYKSFKAKLKDELLLLKTTADITLKEYREL
jgi:hypothetical protein